MNGAGPGSILAAVILAAAVAGSGARAQDAGPGNSWAPVETAPATPPKPAQPLPKEPSADPAAKSWAPPGLVAPPDSAPSGQVCGKADFEAVVDDAAGALRDLNLQNKPAFQEKLRQLKDKRGWSHDAFLKEAAPYVRDEKIAVFDQDSERLLADISTLGQEGADAPTPDCALLADLKSRMKTLVNTQTAKWSYMFQKLETALAQ
ncbi:MAG: hypothetical protein ACK4TP_09505 [Hyphomicrobium sp.]|jgi:hypothetical protein